MISSEEFDYFLKRGYLNAIEPGSHLTSLISKFGNDNWYVKDYENNGKILGIIKVGITELHIYNEMISGVSFRPDILFNSKDYKGIRKPWIIKSNTLDSIIEFLNKRNIKFTKYLIDGPLKFFKTAGVDLFSIEEGQHTIIDTEGGVTFLFNSNFVSGEIQAYQICKYYKKK